jgi:hypothetical protein
MRTTEKAETRDPELPIDRSAPPRKGNGAVPADANDLAALLRREPDRQDPLTVVRHHEVPLGAPRDFFRTHPDLDYRMVREVYVPKSENAMKIFHLVGPRVQGQIVGARPYLLITCVDREGAPRIWPIPQPRDGERENPSWATQISIARDGLTKWTRFEWAGKGYISVTASPGYAPEPQWNKLPPFEELIAAAFGPHGVIWDKDHPAYQSAMGVPEPAPGADDVDPLQR